MRELSLHLLDLMQNSREAGADTIEVEVSYDAARDRLLLRVTDNGRGMSAEALARAFDPFFTTRRTRDVGLGLPLLKAAAERAGGDARIESRPGRTKVTAEFGLAHIDRAPLGDIVGTLLAVLIDAEAPRLLYRHRVNEDTFEFDSAELAEVLDGVPFGEPEVRRWLRRYLESEIGALDNETTAGKAFEE